MPGPVMQAMTKEEDHELASMTYRQRVAFFERESEARRLASLSPPIPKKHSSGGGFWAFLIFIGGLIAMGFGVNALGIVPFLLMCILFSLLELTRVVGR